MNEFKPLNKYTSQADALTSTGYGSAVHRGIFLLRKLKKIRKWGLILYIKKDVLELSKQIKDNKNKQITKRKNIIDKVKIMMNKGWKRVEIVNYFKDVKESTVHNYITTIQRGGI